MDERRSEDERVRPWWGLGDVGVGVLIVFSAGILGVVLSMPFVSNADRAANSDTGTMPGVTTVFSLIAFQVAMGLWPAHVSRKKGFGPAIDFRLQLRAVDLGIGLLTVAAVFPLTLLASWVSSTLVGLEFGADESTNVDVLTEVQGTTLFFVLVGAVLGAPLVEELFFRGLCLRVLQKRWGTVVAIAGSTVLFVLPHFTWSTWQGTVVLFSSIGTVGLLFAIVTVRVGRLGPTIVAHSLFNLVGALSALSVS